MVSILPQLRDFSPLQNTEAESEACPATCVMGTREMLPQW